MVRKLKDRVRSRFRVPLSEVGGQDTWQRVVVGFAVVGSDRPGVESRVNEIADFIDRAGVAEMVHVEREVLTYGAGPLGEAQGPGDDDWIPDSWKEDGT